MNKKKRLIYTFEDDLRDSLKDPGFKKAWQESETEYLLAKKIIDQRLKKNMSQRSLAKKLKTSQAAISRIETMQANPTLSFLKGIARALDSQLSIQFL